MGPCLSRCTLTDTCSYAKGCVQGLLVHGGGEGEGIGAFSVAQVYI